MSSLPSWSPFSGRLSANSARDRRTGMNKKKALPFPLGGRRRYLRSFKVKRRFCPRNCFFFSFRSLLSLSLFHSVINLLSTLPSFSGWKKSYFCIEVSLSSCHNPTWDSKSALETFLFTPPLPFLPHSLLLCFSCTCVLPLSQLPLFFVSAHLPY